MHISLHQKMIPQIVHSSTVHNSLQMETTQMPISNSMDDSNVTYLCKEFYTAMKMNKLPLYATIWMNLLNKNFSKRSQTQKYILCDSIHKSLKSILWKFIELYTLIIHVLFLLCIYRANSKNIKKQLKLKEWWSCSIWYIGGSNFG